MSMSSHVIGFVPPDDKFKAMFNIYLACSNAGVSIPEEVRKFFGGNEPDPSGFEVDLSSGKGMHPCVVEYWSDMIDGYEVYLDKVPKEIKIIRFFNSY